jgi:hypothetical protein
MRKEKLVERIVKIKKNVYKQCHTQSWWNIPCSCFPPTFDAKGTWSLGRSNCHSGRRLFRVVSNHPYRLLSHPKGKCERVREGESRKDHEQRESTGCLTLSSPSCLSVRHNTCAFSSVGYTRNVSWSWGVAARSWFRVDLFLLFKLRSFFRACMRCKVEVKVRVG